MSGAGAGAGGYVQASAVAETAARAAAAAAAMAIGSSMAEVQAAIADMVDQGLMEAQDERFAYCPMGHAFDRAHESCPMCGSEPGDPPSSQDLVSQENEILNDEDRSGSESESDLPDEEASGVALLERLELALAEAGCSRPQETADALVSIVQIGQPIERSKLEALAEKLGWGERDIDRIQRALEAVGPPPDDRASPDFVSSQSSAEIRIWREGEYLRWDVVDLLKGLARTNRSGLAVLGGVRVTPDRFEKLARERKAWLESLAKALIKERKSFFYQADTDAAMTYLRDVPLTQKEISQTTGISAATLSRWCDYRGRTKKRSKGTSPMGQEMSLRTGVEVETPHGIYPLAAFFSRPARARGASHRSQEALEEEFDQLLALAQEQGLDASEVKSVLWSEYGIDAAGRTIRKYRKKRSKKAALIQTK